MQCWGWGEWMFTKCIYRPLELGAPGQEALCVCGRGEEEGWDIHLSLARKWGSGIGSED